MYTQKSKEDHKPANITECFRLITIKNHEFPKKHM